MTRDRCRAVTAGLVIAAALLSGCDGPAGPAGVPGMPAHPARGYWNRDRLLGARPWRQWELPRFLPPDATPTAESMVLAAPRVGALFEHDAGGNHFCTASVVASPGHDLLITAAHCIHAGKGGGYKSDIVFIPGYQNGSAPHGVWTPARLIVDPRWAAASDPDFDIGFVVLNPDNGKNIEQVLGANQIGFDSGFRHIVRVTGYPASADAPVTCINRTSQQSAHQLRFQCAGYYGGTSGGPWVTRFDRRTRTGTIVGVIGGFQQGGDTDSVSYSPYLDDSIRQLYQEAEAAS